MERSREPMDKNRIWGGAVQGTRATNREAVVVKAKHHNFGGRAASHPNHAPNLGSNPGRGHAQDSDVAKSLKTG
jgi:hypothetical protein